MDDSTIRIAALEQLVKAMLADAAYRGTDAHAVKQKAQGALMGSDGPGGPTQKVSACEYLDSLLGKLAE